MASHAERQPDTTDGDNRQPQDDLVAVPTGSCLESSDSLQGGTPEMRLPGMRGKSQDCQTAALQRSNDRVGISTAGAVFNIKFYKEEKANMKKRILATLLSLCLVVGLLPKG